MIRGTKYYSGGLGIGCLFTTIKGKIAKTPKLFKVTRPDIKFPFFLRTPSSDISTFNQIFVAREYDFEVQKTPEIIIDAGANIGLASIYFSNKFPDAKIIAIEPEESNLELLRKNVAPYNNIVPVSAALWSENTKIDLVDPGLGKWGFMTLAHKDEAESHGKILMNVQGITLNTIMKEHGIDHIDILKTDIEGAEREVFQDSSSWIEKVDALIVELHERMKPGCNRSFYNGSNGFDHEWVQGENIYLTRNRGCLTKRSA